MTFWVYVLRCKDGRYYTGQTDNLDRRIAEHMTGGFCDFTSRRLPVELVWSESMGTRIEALQAEHVIKGWSRAKKEGLIAGDWSHVSYFARSPRERLSTALETGLSTALETGLSTALETSGVGGDTLGALSSSLPLVSSEVERRHPPIAQT